MVPPGFRIRQATHIYIAPDGTLTGEVRCQASGCDDPSVAYQRGEFSWQRDFQDRVAFGVGVSNEGYLAIRRGSVECTVRPFAGQRSFAAGADVFRGDTRIAAVRVNDDCAAGRMTVRRRWYRPDGGISSQEETLTYDPLLGTELSRAVRGDAPTGTGAGE